MVASASCETIERFALLLGLSLFFGLAFEGFYADELPQRPGGVRTFPLLALAGGGLYVLEPRYSAAFIAGLLVVGGWIYAHVRVRALGEDTEGSLIVPICNLLAYTLGALTVTAPVWLCVAFAVAVALVLSVTRNTIPEKLPAAPGVPVITPAADSVSPAGNDPEAMLQL